MMFMIIHTQNIRENKRTILGEHPADYSLKKHYLLLPFSLI